MAQFKRIKAATDLLNKRLQSRRLSHLEYSRTVFQVILLLALILLSAGGATAQFVYGADVGWLSRMEANGYVFKDRSGIQRDCLDILKEEGVSAIRLRVWVNPSDGYCGKKDVAYMAHRADSMGFKILLDFHCSDTWADPSHQTKPAAWANDSLPRLLADLYNHVYGVLDTLKSIGVVPDWVQIGNETDNGMLWPDGMATDHMDNFSKMIDTGYAAVKAVDSTSQVIVHLSSANDDEMYRWMFDGLKKYGGRWDIIGMSVYPYWSNLPWEVEDSLALVTMKDMVSRYGTKVMIVETGYIESDPVNANHFLLDLITKTKSAGGLGVFYWEPESYDWMGYQLGAWDPTTKEPTAALDAFMGVAGIESRYGSQPDRLRLSAFPNPFNPTTTIRYQLSAVSHVTLEVYDILGREVRTLLDKRQYPGIYALSFDGSRMASGVYLCRLVAEGDNGRRFVSIQKLLLLK